MTDLQNSLSVEKILSEDSTYQHEVDMEGQNLVGHVWAHGGTAKMVAQVLERPGSTLEMGAGHLHTLEHRP